MKKEKLINMFFGKRTRDRFFRAFLLLAFISFFVILLITCEFSYSKKDGFSFGKKSIDTEIKYNGGK